MDISYLRERHAATWTSSKPFIENLRGVLIHRPRAAVVIKGFNSDPSYLAITYWCGNTALGHGKDIFFLDAPPDGKLVCQRCEEQAINAGELPSDSIVGKHVHVGMLKAMRTCCANKSEGTPK